ncbi:type III-B CRISPR module RAMP protein Cmr4 [Caloranaerobacter azorensis]|uniref:Type III-B CRISPR module RAMP protein Cmr4 n=1 Tax=Caloranaerobacter azorensis TaxID=116090 RepID=A0A6P1YHA1_9FIRM|nr:type III-B CRISPR module RAMP protein Cmr4 [Caloranaerobacter azorensis]QIB27286.1 type III-B CRISPR module RAMP protein Cmr4 [Caloranaerobacter azorensis]
MYKKAVPFFMITRTPLHAGSGQDLGFVDLPIQREKHTDFPKIEASGIKGSLREAFENSNKTIKIAGKNIDAKEHKEVVKFIFGPEDGDLHAGLLGFTNARVLLFPVKSIKGVFAWITCPMVLERFKEELEMRIIDDLNKQKELFEIPTERSIVKGSNLIIEDKNGKEKIVLEEYTFGDVVETEECKEFAEWIAERIFPNNDYWKEKMKKDIVVLSNDDFRDFVKFSTEIVTRTKIDNEKGTVEEGALFTEEYLPSETILYSFALISSLSPGTDIDKKYFSSDKNKKEDLIMQYFKDGIPEIMQIGGNATIGKGIVKIQIWEDKYERER